MFWKTLKEEKLETPTVMSMNSVMSSLSAWRNFIILATKNAPSEDSDQSALMFSKTWMAAFFILVKNESR